MSTQTKLQDLGKVGLAALAVLLCGARGVAQPYTPSIPNHNIEGITPTASNLGPYVRLTARPGYISTGDGNSVYFWGYANAATDLDAPAQYSGPTILLNQGQTVTVFLRNLLPVNTSIVFPGQVVTPVSGTPGLLTSEATANGGVAVYRFTATQAGTFLYNSGTDADLQVEMGLVGAIIVRPTGYNATTNRRAYATDDSLYDHEFLFLLTDMDDKIHAQVEAQVKAGQPVSVDTTDYFPVYWFINGRTGPDTLLGAGAKAPWLASQPYNCMPTMHPGQKLLMRVIGAGRDPHPYHHHGNHARMIAKNGRLLSTTGTSADLGSMHYTVPSFPGTTIDSIFTWTGEKLGWDAYGHKPGEPLAPHEYAPDHGKPLPTRLPLDQDLTFGQMYGGSPYLGSAGILPPGEGGFNANNGYMFMWHSHNEKEIVNNDIFPGGMLTLLLIEAWPAQP